MTYTISTPIARPSSYVDGQITAPEFEALIKDALKSSKKRIASVVLTFETDGTLDAGVTFKGANPDTEASFVFHGNENYDGQVYYRADLYRFNEGFDFFNGTVERRNRRTGVTFREFKPGSRTFKASQGWDLRPTHNALRAIELAAPRLRKVLDENFGAPTQIVATKDGYTVTAL